MRFQGLDLNLLVALNALFIDRSVTGAAKRLHIGQPGMSAALNKLRYYFKDDLLVPIGRRMVLTPLAEKLVIPLQESLAQIERGILSQGQFDPATAQQNLILSVSDYTISTVIPDLLANVEQQAPGVTLEIKSLTDRNDLDIERCETDLIVVPSEFTSPEHPREALHIEHWVCVCWDRNKAIGETITEDEYVSFPHVAVRFGRGQLTTHDERYLRDRGIVRRVEITVPGFNVIPEILVGSKRIATLPMSLAVMASRRLPLKLVPLPIEIPPHVHTIQWNRLKGSDLGLCWVKDRLLEADHRACAKAYESMSPDQLRAFPNLLIKSN